MPNPSLLTMPEPTSPSITLTGLDGSNPLAFLAALGTLRTLTDAGPEDHVRLSWHRHAGACRPRINTHAIVQEDQLIETLYAALNHRQDRPAFQIGDNLNLPATDFHQHLLDSLNAYFESTETADRDTLDYFAAFGSDAIANDKGTMADTALRTMSGAGHQHFLKFFRDISKATDPDHLRRALFHEWDYADEGRGLNLRWDPLDDRRYALRWQNPSNDPNRTMRGANRLAMEAMPLLPTMPVNDRLITTAFQGKGARDTFFTWPIWSAPLSASVVQSLLSHLAIFLGSSRDLQARGISAVYTSARITTGKFRSFTPGVAVA